MQGADRGEAKLAGDRLRDAIGRKLGASWKIIQYVCDRFSCLSCQTIAQSWRYRIRSRADAPDRCCTLTSCCANSACIRRSTTPVFHLHRCSGQRLKQPHLADRRKLSQSAILKAWFCPSRLTGTRFFMCVSGICRTRDLLRDNSDSPCRIIERLSCRSCGGLPVYRAYTIGGMLAGVSRSASIAADPLPAR